MSGGPPHHPHNRQVPTTNFPNSAWNHLQVPNFFPRQPQLAHMSNEHSILHQPTWHTPTTTEAMKILPHHPQVFESLFPRDCVDLSLTRNGSQNGELPQTPISLSVRDTNKINSLPPSALEIQAVELTKPSSPGAKSGSPILKSTSPCLISAPSSLLSTSSLLSANSSIILGGRNVLPTGHSLISPNPIPKSVSPGLKSLSPGLKSASPGLKPASPGLKLPSSTTLDVVKTQKRSNVRVDSILERLNTMTEKIMLPQDNKVDDNVAKLAEKSEDKMEACQHSENPVSVIVQPTSSFDDNSNSSSILNVPTSTNIKDDDTVSSYSNEDSLDSNKSRRKRKPSKTVRVSKDEEKVEAPAVAAESVESVTRVVDMELEKDPVCIVGEMLEEPKNPEKVESSNELDELIPAKMRRKTSSESETIDDIAAMVQEGLKEKQQRQLQQTPEKPMEQDKIDLQAKPISVSVIKTKENLTEVLADTNHNSHPVVTPAQKKATNTHFVEVENKLEEMFAGIEDISDPIKSDPLNLDDSLLKLDDSIPSTSQKGEPVVTSSTEIKTRNASPKKPKRKTPAAGSRRNSDANSLESTPKKKKAGKGMKAKTTLKANAKKPVAKATVTKVEPAKDVYAYDSGSNASSTKSKGPFIQIRGPRESPLSVSVVNIPVNEEDGDRKLPRTKKYHDDSEYRHKVRSKGLHCSTLSNKYDAQTKDATWICSFCKRGPHASELSGPTSSREVVPPGDLFGPYFITTQCPEFERRLDDPYDKHFRSKKIHRALDEAGRVGGGKKVKRKHSDYDASDGESDIYFGITETSTKTYEVWAHEDCIVWSPGIYLIGPKIVGLEEAIWTSCNVACRLCGLKGANISCLRRGCLNVMHLCCSRSNNWQFIEDDFKAYCPEHRVP